MPDQEATIALLLTGERSVQAGMAETALSVRGLRDSLIEANVAMDTTHHRSFLMNQALFTARRLLYGVTLASGALGAATLAMGLQFNMTMENNTVAMTQFLGSSEAANKELNLLYDVAAKTPFEFTNIVDATRRFLAFGISLQDTNRYLRIIGDTAAAFGGGADSIQRMVLVFGQMHAAGRVLGQDLLQLEQIGIPALQILQEQFHLSPDQMANIGRLHIPADIAIEAIMRGLDSRFHGLSEKQSKTLQGRISTLHDYAARMFGNLTLPLYNRLRDEAIPKVTELVKRMSAASDPKKGGSLRKSLGVVDEQYGTKLVRMFSDLTLVAKGFVLVLTKGLLPVLIEMNRLFAPLHILLVGVGEVFITLGHHSTTLRILISLLVVEMLRLRLTLLILGGPGGKGGLIGMIVRGIGIGGKGGPGALLSRFQAWKNIVQLLRYTSVTSFNNIRYAWMGLTTGVIQNADGSFRKITKLQTAVLGLRTAFLELTLAEQAALTAGIALIAAGVILYFTYQPWHDLVNRIAKSTWRYVYALSAFIFAIFPATAATLLLIRYWSKFSNVVGYVVHQLLRVLHLMERIGSGISGFGHHLLHPLRGMPGLPFGLAAGTPMVTQGGAFLVGERGPELAMLPAGSAVSPISATNFPVGQGNGGEPRVYKFQIFLDGKELTRSHARNVGDKKARS